MEYKVKRIGSFNDSKKDYTVRLSRQERQRLGVQTGFVRVKKGEKSAIAIVQKQSVDLLSYPDICVINQLLADFLSAQPESMVTITNDVTTEEVNAYTSQAEYEKRLVLGVKINKNEKKRAKKLLDSLFANEPEESETDESNN